MADAGKLGANRRSDIGRLSGILEDAGGGRKGSGEVDKKIRFLRRIPRDPFTNSTEWGKRSTQDEPDVHLMGRAERLRYVFEDYGKGERWHSILGVVTRSGFTMIELMIVMAVITILVSIAVPFYQKSIIRSKESVLKNNLFTMRTVIDEYTMDKGRRRRACRTW